MQKLFYLDTSIWLDLFEDRDEPNNPKGQLAHELLNNIIKNDDKIIYSNNNIMELYIVGYSSYEINRLFRSLKPILIFVESTKNQVGKAKDISLKRNIPKRDVLHALIARDTKSTLITLDSHFQKILDIIKPKRPQDII